MTAGPAISVSGEDDAMTEAEWLACTDPMTMLEFLRGKVSDRKMRLFACACCRRIWPLIASEPARGVVEVMERHAEGGASHQEVVAAADNTVGRSGSHDTDTYMANFAAESVAKVGRSELAWLIVASCAVYATGAARDEEMIAQADLIREIIGQPFHPF